ncbi:MAG TPA: D-alanyl-D-alanine carboxypeptidase family protein [Lachnospiraceae bacterium]|nr:D-alanyl-D-alanine carboxypeptidase family protein [Lachnospiraceae bacterium]
MKYKGREIKKLEIKSLKKCLKKAALAIAIMIIVLLNNSDVIAVENSTNIKLYAQSAVLMDADSGRVLFEKNGCDLLPMASTTKIMTCIIALEYGNLDDIVTVSSYAERMPKVKLYMKEGEHYYLKDLLYSLMLESHNDTAVAIAEHIGGTVEGFAKLMNQKARDIGCFNTYFITPNGLDATATVEEKDGNKIEKTHSTTASDLARIMSYCIKKSEKKEEFLNITGTSTYHFSNVLLNDSSNACAGNRSMACNNHNAFLTMMEGALSGKTGFTGNAGYCYVGALEKDGKTFVVALLACGWPNHKNYKWSDTKELMNYGLTNYEYVDFNDVKIDFTKLEPIEVIDGQTNKIGDVVKMGLKIADQNSYNPDGMLLRKDEHVDVVYTIPDTLNAPINSGELIGRITYKVDGKAWKTKSVKTSNTVLKINFKWCYEKVLGHFYL